MAVRADTPAGPQGAASNQTIGQSTGLRKLLPRWFHVSPYLLILSALLLIALGLRIYGQRWDDGHLFHPDERHIFIVTEGIKLPASFDLKLLLSPESPLNPRSFAYGSLPFYLLRGIAVLLGEIGKLIGDQELSRMGNFDHLSIVGRTLSALFDVATIALVYLIGRRLYRREVGLLAAAFVTFAAIHIQLSHFYASDTPMSFFTTLSLFASIFLMRSDRKRYAVLAGIAVGLALTSKISAAPILAAVGTALLLRIFTVEDERGRVAFRRPNLDQMNAGVIRIVLTGLATAATFVVIEPYAIIDFNLFSRQVAEQSAMVRGIADLPYTRQYADRTAYLYFLENLTLFGLGIPLGLAAIAGWIYAIVRVFRSPRRAEIVLLAFVIPYFLITGGFHAKFLRYLLPITPVLLLFAADALWTLRRWAGQWKAIVPEQGLAPALAMAAPALLTEDRADESETYDDELLTDGDDYEDADVEPEPEADRDVESEYETAVAAMPENAIQQDTSSGEVDDEDDLRLPAPLIAKESPPEEEYAVGAVREPPLPEPQAQITKVVDQADGTGEPFDDELDTELDDTDQEWLEEEEDEQEPVAVPSLVVKGFEETDTKINEEVESKAKDSTQNNPPVKPKPASFSAPLVVYEPEKLADEDESEPQEQASDLAEEPDEQWVEEQKEEDVVQKIGEKKDEDEDDIAELDELEPDKPPKPGKGDRSLPARDESVIEFSEPIRRKPLNDDELWERVRRAGVDDETILAVQAKGLSPRLFLDGDGDSSDAVEEAGPASTSLTTDQWDVVRRFGVDEQEIRIAQAKGFSPELFLGLTGPEFQSGMGQSPIETPTVPDLASDEEAFWDQARASGLDEDSISQAKAKGLSPYLFLGEDDGLPVQPTAIEPVKPVAEPASELYIDEPDAIEPARPNEPAPLPAIAQRYPWLGQAMRSGLLEKIATGLIGFVLATTAFYGLAFVNMYSEEHPAAQASKWIYQNVPSGAALATEHWEEGMPVGVMIDGRLFNPGTQQYRNNSLNLYEPDNQNKYPHIVTQLRQSDYIIFFSNRLYGTIPRLPERYPLSTRYYQLLFGEQLGYELVGAFTSYPNLFGIRLVDDTFGDPRLPTPRLIIQQARAGLTINLGRADESFTVYDHPKTLVFKKTRQLSDQEFRDLFGAQLVSQVSQPGGVVETAKYKSLTLTPAQRALVEVGGTFREMFDRKSLANAVPIVSWVLLVALIGIAALPLTFAVLRHLPDRGLLLSRTLGLLLLAWLVWILVNIGFTNSNLTITGVFVLMLMAGIYGIYRQRAALLDYWRENRRLILIGEGVFWGAFVLFLMIRLANPDLWHPARGGEKPMDIAYLMAAIKTIRVPPYDPWFAGGYLNYYYFGQVIVATLIKLSGILPTMAYNLVVPLLYALTASGVFSVVYNLVRRSNQGPIRTPVIAGLLGALLATTLGNLGGFGQIIDQLGRIGGQVSRSAIPGLGQLVTALVGLFQVAVGRQPFPINTDWYWTSTRVLEGTINEFPYFTFLYADLHAHMIGLPFTVLALAVAVNIVKSGFVNIRPAAVPWPNGALHFATTFELPRAGLLNTGGYALTRLASAVSLPALAALVTAGLVVGALQPINSWDYPTYLGLVSLAMLVPWYFAPERNLVGLATTAIRIAAVAALSYVLYLPFSIYFQGFYTGVRPIPDKSNVGGYLVIHGVFLAVMVSYLLLDLGRRYGRLGAPRMIGMVIRWWDRVPRALRLQRRLSSGKADARGLLGIYLGLGLLVIVALAIALNMALVGIAFAVLVWVAFAALQTNRPVEEAWALALYGTGLALTIVTELVAIDGDIGRMNTVFKFYLQIWIMWSVATVVALVGVSRWLAQAGITTRRVWLGLLIALFVCASVYPVVATYARVRDRFFMTELTLDGTRYMQNAIYVDKDRQLQFKNDLAAIEWIQDNIKGTPTILEANTPLYRWGSRISIYTGLPTVIGWDWHQKQQRAGSVQAFAIAIDQRMRDVIEMYQAATPDRTMALLAQYGVDYVYLGELERAYYPAAQAKLDGLTQSGRLEVVYDQQGVKVYKVRG